MAILRRVTESPLNASTPLSALGEGATPNDLFYVRNHFDVPSIDADRWSLLVTGAVRRERTFTLADLRRLPARTVTTTLECAGNGRTRMRPRPKGVLWDDGAVSTAKWTGPSLADVLRAAGVADGVVEVAARGADRGTLDGKEGVTFERSLPVGDAIEPDVLVALT